MFADACKRDITFQLTASQGGWHPDNAREVLVTIFQLTASQGGWRKKQFWFKIRYCISTHSLTRRLTTMIACKTCLIQISTHSLTRRLTYENARNTCDIVFQLTASQGGWRAYPVLCPLLNPYFNSQPHKEADERLEQVYNKWCISTHSLTRRLTE